LATRNAASACRRSAFSRRSFSLLRRRSAVRCATRSSSSSRACFNASSASLRSVISRPIPWMPTGSLSL
jgi:hypothetical protein